MHYLMYEIIQTSDIAFFHKMFVVRFLMHASKVLWKEFKINIIKEVLVLQEKVKI